MSARDVEKNLLMLPWVEPVKRDLPCDGIKWGQVALRDIYTMGGKPPRGIQERAKCKRRAKFRLRATKRLRAWDRPATSGNYCLQHLSMQISHHEAEKRRADAWFDTKGWWRNGVFGLHKEKEEQA